MSELLNHAIQSVRNATASWCRFITGNDAGTTGSHQAGFYVPKAASKLLFETPGTKGENKEKAVKIKWQNDFETESCMKYYGVGTRNEYRITRFGRNFPFLQDEHVGSLLILSKYTEDDYVGYVLSADDDIEEFFSFFSLSPGATNQLIETQGTTSDDILQKLFDDFISEHSYFPETKKMAFGARDCYNKANRIVADDLCKHPDDILLGWINAEYSLFRCMENKIYHDRLSQPFASVEDFVQSANEVLNRRKSRAGKSLEHHLSDIFTCNKLVFEEQAITEDNKKPDFLFPNSECYHNILFPTEDLVVLGAKTTCKDRWRQVLTEANRVEEKYLFTLQQGISRNQLREMNDSHLTLVVPRQNISTFPKEYHSSLLDLSGFINIVAEKQTRLPKHYIM